MYNNEEMNWFSQTLMTYKDNQFATDGYMRIAISTGTKDFLNFHPVKFGISISNQLNKNCNLDIFLATDLLSSFRTIMKNSSQIYREGNYQILKRYNNLEFIFEFVLEQNNNEQVVRIILRSNESDFVKIIIPFDLFQVLSFRLKYFVENYDNLCLSTPNIFLQKEILNTNNQILSSLNKLPSKLLDFSNNSSSKEELIIDNEVKENIEISENTIEELDKFIGGSEMENIKDMPELEMPTPKKENLQEYNSKFISCLENKLENFEKILTLSESHPSPMIFIIDKLLKDKMMLKENTNNFNFMFGISNDDLKSILYMSKLNCNITLRNNIEKGIPIPSSIPLFKYKIDSNINIPAENIELGFDLVMINAYLRSLKRKLETKIEESMLNKSFMYLIFRSYTDIFSFSFLEHLNKDTIKTNIVSRFKYYDRIGFFDSYKTLLETYNCSNVTDIDIGNFVNDVIEKVIGKSLFLDEIHTKLYDQGDIRLAYENSLSKEQIINEVVPIEIVEKIETNIDHMMDNISKEVVELFSKKSKTKSKTKTNKENSNLYRLLNQYRNEIPEKTRKEFLEMIQKLGNKPIDLFEIEFPLETFDENIIKILYIWKPEEDIKITTNFKYFFEKFENEIMTKEYILTKIKTDKGPENNEWDEFEKLI